MKSHKDLDVWRLAVELATEVYRVTKSFPKEEQYGMVAQMRRAAVSIASNVAEGAARQGGREFAQFLHIALGSASELDTQLEIARRVDLAKPSTLDTLQASTTRVGQMLRGLTRSLRESQATTKA
jgi:four helix bundle protein